MSTVTILTYKDAELSELPEITDLIIRSKSHFHPNKAQYVIDFVQTWGPNATILKIIF